MRVCLRKVFFGFLILPLLIGGVFCDKNKILTTLDAKEFCGVGSFFKKSIKNFFIPDLTSDDPAETAGLAKIGDKSGFLQSLYTTVFKKPLKIDYEPFGEGIIATIEISSFSKEGKGFSVLEDLREALAELKAVAPLNGLILDMRENKTLFSKNSAEVADFFLQKESSFISSYRGPFLILLSKVSGEGAQMIAETLQKEGIALVASDLDEKLAADIFVPTRYASLDLKEKALPYLLSEKEASKKIASWEVEKIFSPYHKYYGLQWKKMVPILSKNSQLRKENDQNLYLFCKNLEDPSISFADKASGCGSQDLQKKEAINIVKDMILLSLDGNSKSG